MSSETSNNPFKRVNCDLEISIMSQFEVWEQNKFKMKQFARVDQVGNN